MLPPEISNSWIPKSIYKSGDKILIEKFEEFLPKVPSSIFHKEEIPEYIKLREQKAAKDVSKFINKKDLERIEEAITEIQRIFRGKKRKKEESELIKKAFTESIYKDNEYIKEIILKNRNKIYEPNCNKFPGLSQRLLEAAKKIDPFNKNLCHFTAKETIDNIFDEGIKGRKTLLELYNIFRPAALMDCDLKNGDSNVICMSLGEIDDKCKKPNTLELVIDFEKFLLKNKNNSSLFFKQLDLGFPLYKNREIYIKNEKISFNHTEILSKSLDFHSGIKFYCNNKYSHYSEIFNFSLISSNLKEMFPILAMNFFRYLDSSVSIEDDKKDENFTNSIYKAFSELNDKELISNLKELTEKIADTMEFNAYGYIGLKPEYIKKINLFDGSICQSYNLDMQDFISGLKCGNKKIFEEALKNIPELFKSYKFIDYLTQSLVGVTEASDIKYDLIKLREKIELPLWRKEFEEKEKADWEKYWNEIGDKTNYYGINGSIKITV